MNSACGAGNQPGRDVDALSHEGAEREPEAVEDGEVVGEGRPVLAVLDLPLVRTEAADEEQDETDAEIRQHDAQPDVEVERIHEREHARLLLLRLLDHDADAEVHERLAEVDHALADRRDGERSDGDVRILRVSHAELLRFWNIVTSLPSHVVGPRSGADRLFCMSSARHCSFRGETTDTGQVHRVMCLFTPQLSPVPSYTAR